MMLIEVINKGSVPYCGINDDNSTEVSLSDILFLFMLYKYIVCNVCGLRSPSFVSGGVLYITPTYISSMQESIMLSSAASGMSLELRLLARFQWREAYVLDNWQLVELPQSGGREFDPRRVHDNLSVPLWVHMRFPVPEHQN